MTRTILICAAMACATVSQAQKIDFNNNASWAVDRLTEPGFTPWAIAQGTSENAVVDGLNITVGLTGGLTDRVLKGNWWKQGVQNYSRLVGDGISVYALTADGNTPRIVEGAVEMAFVIDGLAAGEHSLLAYHNNTDGCSGPDIDVYVDGVRTLGGAKQTSRAQTPLESGQSYIRFKAETGRSVTVVYRTVPDPSTDYAEGNRTTSLFVNALVFDRPNPLTTAADPSPANGDTHADTHEEDGDTQQPSATEHDSGVTLAWTAAATARKHHILFGTDPERLEETAVTDKPECHIAQRLSSMNTYYWRVDEEDAGGNIYAGDVWSFRPRRVAFPGAEGYGRFAIGGRGGEVYHVTSLDDDADNPLPGSLRYGITRMSGPRTIVFDVGGVITLKARLTVADKYVTIAGQTAPGRGIMMRGKPFGMQSDGITRFLRMRVGGADNWDGISPNENTSDGMGMAGNDHAIMDHCSVSWTIDEAFSSRNAANVTLQRTLISEALNQAGHKNYTNTTNHGYAATIGGDCGSYHHNLMAHCEGRNWSMSGGLDGGGSYAGRHDMYNNVCYNWGGRACDGGTHEGQFVANYYKMGPATTQKTLLKADLEGTGTGSQSYYVAGNIRENTNGTMTGDALGDTYKYTTKNGQVVDWTVFRDEPFFSSHGEITTAAAALRDVLSDVGCNQPAMDNHDTRMVSETLNGTTTTTGSRTGKKGLIDKESDAEGFDGLNITEAVRPEGFDRDGDGMPDWYEDMAGTNKAEADNNGMAAPMSIYTNLEEYINWMAAPHFFIKPGVACEIDLKPFFAGFKDGAMQVDGTADGAETTADGRLIMNITATGLTEVPIVCTDKETGTAMKRTFNFCVTDIIPELEVTDGIDDMKAERTGNDAIYNLSGMRVEHPAKGIYIINKKKRRF